MRWIIPIPAVLLTVSALSGAAVSRQRMERTVTVELVDYTVDLYRLIGGSSTSLALVRKNGVVLIDTKPAGWAEPTLRAIEAVSDRPVTMIINTHAHSDHTAGNSSMPADTQIVAHERTRANMEKMDAFRGPNDRFLPNRVVAEKMSLWDGRDGIDLHYFGAGHTDGDLVVIFPELGLAYLGDLFLPMAAPVIDAANGGSGVAFPQTLTRAIAELRRADVTRIIAGHDVESTAPGVRRSRFTMSDLQEYADFNHDFLESVQDALRAGKSAAEAAATVRLPERYKDYDLSRLKANVEAIYKELKR